MARDLRRDAVSYEATISRSSASLARLGDLQVTGRMTLLDSYAQDRQSAVLMLQVSAAREDEVRAALKPIRWRYVSPTRFERGTLRALYASPADELIARVARTVPGIER
ncbi:MAG: hypothetical protein H6981_04520 [Gammaproteobacteria bacterium]|nr:hypothetical protein [Gammaproteobacteria bacterium]